MALDADLALPSPGSNRDVVLMHGVEPNMRWRTFCAELLAIADKLNVETVVILGALLADTPHTRPVPVSGSAYSAESAKFFGLEETRYEGPTGIAGVFQDACVQAGIPAVTFWAAVPHYVSQPPSPKATVATAPGGGRAGRRGAVGRSAWRRRGMGAGRHRDDRRGRGDRGLRRLLEERGDAEVDMHEVLGKIDGDALAAEFERYLRRRGR